MNITTRVDCIAPTIMVVPFTRLYQNDLLPQCHSLLVLMAGYHWLTKPITFKHPLDLYQNDPLPQCHLLLSAEHHWITKPITFYHYVGLYQNDPLPQCCSIPKTEHCWITVIFLSLGIYVSKWSNATVSFLLNGRTSLDYKAHHFPVLSGSNSKSE